jgi:hypothetical protein
MLVVIGVYMVCYEAPTSLTQLNVLVVIGVYMVCFEAPTYLTQLNVLVVTGVYMVCYEASKDIFANSLFPAHMSAAAPAAAAFVSRGFTATLSTPLEVVKTRQQDGSTNSAITELRSIYQKTGYWHLQPYDQIIVITNVL